MTGQDDSKFGFGLASGAAAEAVERLRHPTSWRPLVGVHAHIGSQIFALECFEQALAVLGPFFYRPGASTSSASAAASASPYVTGETAPSITEWAKTCEKRRGPPGSPTPWSSDRRAGPGHRGGRRASPATRSAPSRPSRACGPMSASTAA